MNNNTLRKICVVTGTRAEYGLLSRLMAAIQNAETLQLQVIACAAHLSAKHGMTVNQILADGFQVDAGVEMLEDGDDAVSVVKSVAKGLIGFADALQHLKPDILVMLGDRYEMLAAAQAALLMNVPIAHIHGGELTFGAVDESIRHAITKMASLHFTATEPYRQRVIQMGERPDRVFNVGAPGLDLIRHLRLLTRVQLVTELNMSLNSPLFLITYHPVTWGTAAGMEALQNLFAALAAFPQATIVWTAPNADVQGETMHQMIKRWSHNSILNVHLFASLGSARYLSVMALADVVIGNSSSGIIEAPAIGTPTVNIGSRQQGRLRSPSILDCDESEEGIHQSICKALTLDFQKLAAQKNSVYGQGNSVEKMLKILSEVELKHLNTKAFYDLVDKPLTTPSKDRL
ncbi:UDP-N-acetylglucosamine 2-epimerase [Thiomicrospira pelophila]|uniref:UDP-N-acetylglucosamine 2-epimerase n=1 Tax=Thiomicrospira pelophila TaxID=934 RepID=UPI001B7FFD11|nr:UDP-N-acetylglucosamine 2-epimerase [Thiomicrospira pelophila]